MRTWLLVGSLAAGILVFVYEWYYNREQMYEGAHHDGSCPPDDPVNEDFIEINTSIPRQATGRLGHQFKLPGNEEVCSICLEHLVKRNVSRRYCIIALPQCGHWFHQRCALRLLEYHPQCPVCRIDIDSAALRSTTVRVMESTLRSDNSDTSSNTNQTATTN